MKGKPPFGRFPGRRTVTREQGHTQMILMLASCTPERLEGFTVGQLMHLYNTTRLKAEKALNDARQRRMVL